mmetsp:Transcript_22925/g.48134  ORF Transcript_22925/g.48134 Transcript_22925/m.48134 type:complete len:652 (-) Transcript_22925:64-2019(-)
MAFSHHSRYNPSRRRRRQHYPSSHSSLTLSTVATTAAVAYGAYRLGSWLWSSYFDDGDDEDGYKDQDKHGADERQLVDEAGDVLYEWCNNGDSRTNKKSLSAVFTPQTQREKDIFLETEEDDPFASVESDSGASSSSNRKGTKRTQLYRSRRSRHDWSEENHHKRSHRPSPSHHHHHHHHSRHGKEQQFIEETEEIIESYATATEGKDKTNNSGLLSKGMSKAASLAKAGMTTAMNAAIKSQFGNHALNNNSGDGSNTTISPFLRNSRMARCRVETTRAMLDFLPTLKKAVAKETDASKETGELKRLRVKRREILENGSSTNGDECENEVAIRERERILWNAIKIKSITRLVTTAYAHTIVYLVLTVQVNLLGGRLLRDEIEERTKSQSQTQDGSSPSAPANRGAEKYRSSHQTVLARTYHRVFSKGIPSLAAEVANAVEMATRQYDVRGAIDNSELALKADASFEDVASWIENTRDHIEHRQKQTKAMSSVLTKFVIPPEDQNEDCTQHDAMDELARHILDETFDLLESPIFTNAERSCLDATFTELRDDRYAKLFSHSSADNGNSSDGDHGDMKKEEEEERKPLANVVTHLQKSAVATFHRPPSHKEEMESWGGILGMMEEPLPSAPNSYLPILERLSSVLELGDVCFD